MARAVLQPSRGLKNVIKMRGTAYDETQQLSRLSHQQAARKDRSQFISVNNGHPAATTMSKVNGDPFNERGHTAATSTLGRNYRHLNTNAESTRRNNGKRPHCKQCEPNESPANNPNHSCGIHNNNTSQQMVQEHQQATYSAHNRTTIPGQFGAT